MHGVTALGAGGLALVGCGAPGDSGVPSASSQPVTIRWTNDVGTPTADAFNADMAKRAQQKFNGKINLQVEGHPDPDWAIRYQKYTAMALANALPEIITLCCQFIRPFMVSGLAFNLDNNIRKDWKQAEIDDFYKPQYEAFKIDGKQMGIPVYVNVNIMFVNRNLLKEAGLAYPADDWSRPSSWTTPSSSTSQASNGRSICPSPARTATAPGSTTTAEPHDPKDGPVVTKLTYDDPKSIEGLQFLHDLLWKHQDSPKNDADRGGLNRDDAFLNGKTAIVMDAASSTGANYFNKAPASGLDWDFLPLPKGPGGYGARISTDGYMIDKSTKFADQSWIALKELTSAETGIARGEVQRQQPPRKSVVNAFEKGYAGKTARLAKIMAETGRPDPRAFWKDAVQAEVILKKYLDASIGRNEQPVSPPP